MPVSTNMIDSDDLSANAYELLIQGAIDYAIYMLDPKGYVVSWNPGAERIKGYTADEIVGTHFSRFYTDEDRAADAPENALRIATETGRFTTEAWRCRKDGSRFWAMVVIDAIRRGDRLIGFAKITRDLSERREAQIQLEQSREQLFQSQKMEAIGQLTGGIAHDFNNLLTGIAGSLELLKARVARGRIGDLDRFITAAQGATVRAAALTHRLLAFARRQALDPKRISANSLITDMMDLVQRTVGPGIRVSSTLMSGLWPSLCDPHQLENAILNLCINARDAMPDGGQLTIETANVCIDDRGARERDMQPGQYTEICVTDTGTGMPSDVVARVFEPFFTTKPLGQGTGLGLSMIYGFVKQSGGQVRITSELAVGTSVRIYLPRAVGGAEEDLPEVKPVEPTRANAGETILIVDDEPTVRMLITEVLEGLGYAAIEAADAHSALKVLQSNVCIDLLITDVGLPGSLTGLQMVDAARSDRPDLKVLCITGYPLQGATRAGGLVTDLHMLTKPFTLETLARRVEVIIGKN
jgi:PAS domain S-box-containing protein